jgi:hypothetical protein
MHFSIVLHCWKNICQGAKSTVSLMTQSPLCWCMSQTWKQIKKWTFLKNKFIFILIGYVGTWGCCFIDYYPTSSFDISHDKVCDIWLSLGFLLSIGSSNNKRKRKEAERNGQDHMLTYKIEIECALHTIGWFIFGVLFLRILWRFCFCRNPTLAKCGGEAQHLEK